VGASAGWYIYIYICYILYIVRTYVYIPRVKGLGEGVVGCKRPPSPGKKLDSGRGGEGRGFIVGLKF
jgi:hypothetical protein